MRHRRRPGRETLGDTRSRDPIGSAWRIFRIGLDELKALRRQRQRRLDGARHVFGTRPDIAVGHVVRELRHGGRLSGSRPDLEQTHALSLAATRPAISTVPGRRPGQNRDSRRGVNVSTPTHCLLTPFDWNAPKAALAACESRQSPAGWRAHLLYCRCNPSGARNAHRLDRFPGFGRARRRAEGHGFRSQPHLHSLRQATSLRPYFGPMRLDNGRRDRAMP